MSTNLIMQFYYLIICTEKILCARNYKVPSPSVCLHYQTKAKLRAKCAIGVDTK